MFQAIEDFLLHKALGRAVVVVAQAAGSYALAHSGALSSYGVSVSVDPNTLAAGLTAGASLLSQWLGSKLGARFPALGHALGANIVSAQVPPAA